MSRDELIRELAYKRYIEDPDGPVVLSRDLADEVLDNVDDVPHVDED